MKETTKNIIKTFCLILITFILGVASTLFVIDKYPNLFQETITKVEKDVTVTENGIADSVEKVYDSVVVISTYQNNTNISSGSGFIYKVNETDTYIITNHHVIDGGNSFKATYTDGDILEATLMGSDEYSDIAVLKVASKENYQAVEIGSSTEMRVGDTTFTIGAPLGDVYSWTVTRGILSGKERLVEVSLTNTSQSDYIMNVLQTDSAVNSGNSGGPISNSNGEVIGVVNAKISSTGVEGIGFAIPIEVAIEKAEQIINGNGSNYPYLGISMLDIDTAKSYPKYRRYFSNNNITSGVIIVDIEDGSPADVAGLESEDIIIEINGQSVSNVAYLRYELYKCEVNETISVKVLRDGEEKNFSVDLSLNLEKS